MTATPNDKVTTSSGTRLTRRAWASIEDAFSEVGLGFDPDENVGQGGFRQEQGGGASASAGTHDVGDVADIRTRVIPSSKVIPLVIALRKRNWCAWPRTPEYGWTGPEHIHAVLRDSHYGLSDGAWSQVDAYDRHTNGLANDAHDPLPHPVQHPFVMDQPPITVEDDDMPIILVKGRQKRLLSGNVLVNISDAAAVNLTKAGVKTAGIPLTDWPAIEGAFVFAKGNG